MGGNRSIFQLFSIVRRSHVIGRLKVTNERSRTDATCFCNSFKSVVGVCIEQGNSIFHAFAVDIARHISARDAMNELG